MIELVPIKPVIPIVRSEIPINLKIVSLIVLMMSKCYVGDIYPYSGITIRLGKDTAPIIVVDKHSNVTVLIHELVHAFGGNEFSAEIVDAVTGGTTPTRGELTNTELDIVNEIRRL